jgi:regulator of sigma E protease
MARLCRIKVLVFSIGFGLKSRASMIGTERWKISAVRSGYVKFFGDDNAASVPDQAATASMSDTDRKDGFMFQPVRSRAAALPVLSRISCWRSPFLPPFHDGQQKRTTSARVDTVQPASAAEAAGFKPGDLVTAINGEKIEFLRRTAHRQHRAGETLSIDVDGGARPLLNDTPTQGTQSNFGNAHRRCLVSAVDVAR